MARGRPPAPLTERDMETLGELIAAADSHARRYPSSDFYGCAPIDFGGSNGSHHGATATKLAKRGLVEQRKRGLEWGEAPKRFRGSKVYRPTAAGRNAYWIWLAVEKPSLVLFDPINHYLQGGE